MFIYVCSYAALGAGVGEVYVMYVMYVIYFMYIVYVYVCLGMFMYVYVC